MHHVKKRKTIGGLVLLIIIAFSIISFVLIVKVESVTLVPIYVILLIGVIASVPGTIIFKKLNILYSLPGNKAKKRFGYAFISMLFFGNGSVLAFLLTNAYWGNRHTEVFRLPIQRRYETSRTYANGRTLVTSYLIYRMGEYEKAAGYPRESLTAWEGVDSIDVTIEKGYWNYPVVIAVKPVRLAEQNAN